MLYGKIAPDNDFKVSHEVACVLGALTHDKEIYNHIEQQKGDVNMGQYVLNISKKARLEGKEEGRKKACMKESLIHYFNNFNLNLENYHQRLFIRFKQVMMNNYMP